MKEEYRKGWDQHCKDFKLKWDVAPCKLCRGSGVVIKSGELILCPWCNVPVGAELPPIEVVPVSEVEAAIKKTKAGGVMGKRFGMATGYWVDFIIGLLPRSYNSPAMEMSRITQKINAELQMVGSAWPLD